MYEKIISKVHSYMTANHMLDHGHHVIAGISGGADSMCLLFVLLCLSKKMKLKVSAVHVNHGLRGADADADQQYVEGICKAQGIACISYKTDIKAYAGKLHMSEEEAGRAYRYQCFEETRKKLGADKIAVAHHKNDLAETVLFNVFRGSQLKGLIGIPPVRERIIRPLLCLTRREVGLLTKYWHIEYRTDQTNYETEYTRNKIRLELLPYISQEINSGAVNHIEQISVMALEVYGYIKKQAEKAFESCVIQAYRIMLYSFLKEDIVIQKEIIRRVIECRAGKLKDITNVHIQDILSLKDKSVGKFICLPYGLAAVRTADAIEVIPRDAKALTLSLDGGGIKTPDSMPDIAVPGVYEPEEGSFGISFTLKNREKNERIPQNIYTKWFDYDKISFGLKIRHRCPGDFMIINEQGAKKTIQRLMIDEKIPKACRDRQWLIADGAHIVWMIGGRISEYFKVTKDTKRILVVEVKGEKEHGRQNQRIIN